MNTTIAVLEYSEASEFYCWFVGWLVLIVLHEFWYFSSPTRDWTWAVRAQSPNHWISRELPLHMIFYIANYHPFVSTLGIPSSISCEANLMINLLSFCLSIRDFISPYFWRTAATAKSLQSCPTLYDPIDGSPPGSAIPGILQARTLEWVAISFSNARKWKVKVKSLSRVWLLATPWTAAYQASPSMGFSRHWWANLLVGRVSFCFSTLNTHMCACSVTLVVTLWTVACRCPLSIGFLQTRILEWVAMPSSRGSSQPRSQTHVSCDSSIAGGLFATEPEYTHKHISIVSWPSRFLLKNLIVLWRFPYMWWVSSFTTLIILSFWFLSLTIMWPHEALLG